MKTYTITGGAGFIGSHLADALLARQCRVRVLDDFSTGKLDNLDPRCEVIEGDVADPAKVRLALEGAQGCFHLAAIASVARGNEDWSGTHRVNQTGTVTVLEMARRLGRLPVVYASSAAVYGNVSGVAREDLVPVPRTAYGADKLGSELHARVGWLVHGVPTLGLRFFNVYGPRQDPASPYSGVISIFAKQLADGGPIIVHGDGQQTRDFVFVSDVVAHLARGMQHIESHQGTHIFNVCGGVETSILTLAETLAALRGRRPHIVHGPTRDGDIRRSVGDGARAAATLDVRASVSLRDGLALTVASLQGRPARRSSYANAD